MDFEFLKNIINLNYLKEIINIEKNLESTQGNVYIISTNEERYVIKIYDNLNHTLRMINLHTELSNYLNIPKIIKSKENKSYIKILNKYYIVLYSFINGNQISKNIEEIPVKDIAIFLRKMHDLVTLNKYNLEEIDFLVGYKIKRKSLLHFDLNKNNIFCDNKKIGFIDFDDAKYGYSVIDVAITISFLFISKKRGIDIERIKLFIDSYYGNDKDLKNDEIKYIKDFGIKALQFIIRYNNFDLELEESFLYKIKMLEEYLNI